MSGPRALPASMTKSTLLPLLKPGAVLDGAANKTIIDLGGNHYKCGGGWTLRNAHIRNGGLNVVDYSAETTELDTVDLTWAKYEVLTSTASIIPRMLSYQGTGTLVMTNVDMHDSMATPLTLIQAKQVVIEAMHQWNIYDRPELDPHDISHCDWIAILNGNVSISVRGSYFEGAGGPHRAGGGARMMWQAVSGDLAIDVENTWVQGGEGVAFQFYVQNGHKISGRRANCDVWGEVGQHPKPLIEYVDGRELKANEHSPRIAVTDTNVSVVAPPAGTTDPCTLARGA